MKARECSVPDRPRNPEEADIPYLFVYGTLMRGFENAKFLASPEKASFVCECTVPGLLYDAGSFPAFVPLDMAPAGYSGSSDSLVAGEIYHLEAPEAVLETLDIVEGYNRQYLDRSLFKRTVIEAEFENETRKVWIYVYNQPVQRLPLIESGDYRAFRKMLDEKRS